MNLENGPAFLPSRFYADNSSLFSHIFWGRGVDENICAFPFFAPPFYVFFGWSILLLYHYNVWAGAS